MQTEQTTTPPLPAHTPEPLKVGISLSGKNVVYAGDALQKPTIVAVFEPMDVEGQMKANATLYSASPELLEALQAAQTFLEDNNYCGKFESEGGTLAVKIQLAINKAKGE